MDSNEIKIGGATRRKPAVEHAAEQEAIKVEAVHPAPENPAPENPAPDTKTEPPPSARQRAAQSEYAPRYEQPDRTPAGERTAAFNALAWLADGLTGAMEEARHSDLGLSQEFWTHLYAVRRESLLAAKALVESLLAKTECETEQQQETEQRRARRGGVDIDF